MLRIITILMDYEEQQVGITHMPQFGWIMESDKRNVKQEWYELELAGEKNFQDSLFVSGKVMSEQSAQVMVTGVELQSMTRYYVRIRAAAADECAEWAYAEFVTGLMDNEQWKAQFITAETKEDVKKSKGTYVRKDFSLSGKVKEAFACTTALGIYEFYINGKRVGDDYLTPGWTSYKKHLCYQTYDVTEYLKDGENAMGASLGAGWFKGLMGFKGLGTRRNHYGDYSAFLLQMLVRYEDGREEVLITDETWDGCESPVVFAEIYDGEIYDARREIPGWAEAGLNKTDAKSCETSWKPVSLVSYDMQVLSGQGNGKVAEIEEVTAKEIFVTPQGDTVIDFGQNMSGHIQVTAEGKMGDVIELECFEALDAAGNVYTANLRGVKQGLTYIFGKDGKVVYKPNFTFMGYRYAKINRFPGTPTVENFTTYVLHSNMKPTGNITCSNPDLNQLVHNILWGMKSNFVDVPTDCPQRDERLGWTGDAQIFCRTASFLMNTYSFYRKWLGDVEVDQTPEGGVSHVVPDILTNNQIEDWLLRQGTHSAAAWADVAVIMPWTMYLTYGDQEILRKQYASMKAWIDFMQEHANDYIWNYKLQFGDWVALDAQEGSYFGATPNDLTCTAYFAYSTGLFAKAARVLGKTEDAEQYEALRDRIVEKFQRTFFDEDGMLTAQTQTAHIVALYFGLTPETYKEKTVKGLLRLLEKENGHLVTGFVGTPYFCHALSQNGHVKEAYDLLLKDDFPSWLYQVKMGATTVWEHWDGLKPDGTMWSPDMNSFNHYAYGAIAEWIVRVAAGIELDEKQAGYKHSVIYPRLGGELSWLKAEYDSVYGRVMSCWEDQGDKVILHVTVPVNTTATICLDEAKKVLEADGLTFAEQSGYRKAEAGSGSYRIVYKR